jgi:hypothetical protein
MRKPHGRIFLGSFALTAAAVATLVLTHRLIPALGAGTVGLLIHWKLSAGQENDGELADSSYFFGFLLTLIFLAAGLFTLGSPAAGSTKGPDLLQFLTELGSGLVLTIVGLIVRQVRTLSAVGRNVTEPADSLTAAQRSLAEAMQALVRSLAIRPEEVAARELSDTRARAREAAESLEQSTLRASKRVDESMIKLEEATATVTSAVLRAASSLGDSLTTSTQRIQIEVGSVLSLLETQRVGLEESLRRTQATQASTQQEMHEQMKAQLAEWRVTLQESQVFLAAAHESIDGEYRRGLATLASAGRIFSELAEKVTQDVEALPNPAERLTGLWNSVRSLETGLTASIGGASEELETLAQRSAELSTALVKLERTTGSAAGNIERGGAELGEALRRELTQMNEVLEEYTRLFERNAVPRGTR